MYLLSSSEPLEEKLWRSKASTGFRIEKRLNDRDMDRFSILHVMQPHFSPTHGTNI
jgi:hypothetical protein